MVMNLPLCCLLEPEGKEFPQTGLMYYSRNKKFCSIRSSICYQTSPNFPTAQSTISRIMVQSRKDSHEVAEYLGTEEHGSNVPPHHKTLEFIDQRNMSITQGKLTECKQWCNEMVHVQKMVA